MRVLLLGIHVSAAAVLLMGGNCSELLGPCHGDVLRIRPTVPDTATIHVGASVIATAGEAYNTCGSRPSHAYTWHAGDEAIVSITVLDTAHARITALRVGQTAVTPAYNPPGALLTAVSVTVVP